MTYLVAKLCQLFSIGKFLIHSLKVLKQLSCENQFREDEDNKNSIISEEKKKKQIEKSFDSLIFWVLHAFICIFDRFIEDFISWFPGYYYLKSALFLVISFRELKVSRAIFFQVLVPSINQLHHHALNININIIIDFVYSLPLLVALIIFPALGEKTPQDMNIAKDFSSSDEKKVQTSERQMVKEMDDSIESSFLTVTQDQHTNDELKDHEPSGTIEDDASQSRSEMKAGQSSEVHKQSIDVSPSILSDESVDVTIRCAKLSKAVATLGTKWLQKKDNTKLKLTHLHDQMVHNEVTNPTVDSSHTTHDRLSLSMVDEANRTNRLDPIYAPKKEGSKSMSKRLRSIVSDVRNFARSKDCTGLSESPSPKKGTKPPSLQPVPPSVPRDPLHLPRVTPERRKRSSIFDLDLQSPPINTAIRNERKLELQSHSGEHPPTSEVLTDDQKHVTTRSSRRIKSGKKLF